MEKDIYLEDQVYRILWDVLKSGYDIKSDEDYKKDIELNNVLLRIQNRK